MFKPIVTGLVAWVLVSPAWAGQGCHHAGYGYHHGYGYPRGMPQVAAQRSNPVAADAGSVEEGERLYQANCAVCHGGRGLGNGPAARSLSVRPANLVARVPRRGDGELARVIAGGRGPMPAWRGTLSERQIWEVVSYLRVLAAGVRRE
jgi:mono/diheme cytochrome c family protein